MFFLHCFSVTLICVVYVYLFIGEKTEFEQRHRKLNAKLKAKEQEIQLLQEKLRTLNDKLKNSTINPCGDGGQMDSSTPTIEQLMAELSMNEMQMVELKNEIENGKEQIEQLNDMLCQERDRRKQLDSYYLSSINNRSHGESGLSWGRNGIDSVEHCLHHLHHLHHHHSSTFNHYRQVRPGEKAPTRKIYFLSFPLFQ